MTDARFEDGTERPLRLVAQDAADLRVIAALLQDAVLTVADLSWRPGARRFAALVNRFRWEDRAAATAAGRPPERVRSLLVIGDATAAAHQGLDRRDGETVLSLLTLDYTPTAPPEDPEGPAGPGTLTMLLAGDGAIRLTVECLDVQLTDVTRPYLAPSGRAPDHGV
jgi:hypothetical protein